MKSNKAVLLANLQGNGFASLTLDDITNIITPAAGPSGESIFSVWAVIATPPCCDYNGNGRACGDQLCVIPGFTELDASSPGFLGAGTSSKMPVITETTRQRFSTFDEVFTYLDLEGGTTAPEYQTRRGWKKMCPSRSSTLCTTPAASSTATDDLWRDFNVQNWITPRFGHSIEAASSTRILIYGGVGCMNYQAVTLED
eukprot:642738-Rhodomonas_salina.1